MKSILRKFVDRARSSETHRAGQLKVAAPTVPNIEDVAAQVDAHLAARRFADSLSLIDGALAEWPDDTRLQLIRGNTLLAWGRHREGFNALKRLELVAQNSNAFYQKLGLAAFWTGQFDESERCMRLALATDPDDWEHHFGLGMVLHAAQKEEEAAAVFSRALELHPDERHTLANLVSCTLELGDHQRAETLARRAVELYPKSAVAWSNLGVILDRQCRFEEALAAFDRAAVLSTSDGEDVSDYLSHVICLFRAGKIQGAIDLVEQRLPEAPLVQAHCHYSIALLLSGRFREGWEQYEFRWIDGPLRESRPNFVKPAWIGQELTGKTILLRSEQGFGDFFQFIRYARHVKALGATVHVQLHEAVREVARGVSGIDHILKAEEPYPPFDYYVPLMSLPRIFDTDATTIPADVPYLKADLLRAAKWRARFSDVRGLKVGLAWAGSPTHTRDSFRSLPFSELGLLRGAPEVTFYSLQKGPAAADVRSNGAALEVVDLDSELHDFADTAAVIHQLDLVICVDTAVAHLTAAMGKPVWMMIGTPCDWRWLQDREDTPWYPSMRLFRQSKQGDWSTVVARVQEALKDVALGRIRLPDHSTPPGSKPWALTPRVPEAPNHRLTCATYTRIGFLQYFPTDVVGRSLREYGEYLQPQLDLVSRFVGPGGCVVEIGADIGVHAVSLGKTLGPAGDLFLYESRPTVARVLPQNLAANGVANATIMRRAPAGQLASDASADAVLAAVAPREIGETIDELRLERLSLLKVGDTCDGVEVIEGARETLWRLRPYVFAAASNNDRCMVLASRVREFGYRTWTMKTPLFNPHNFNQVGHDLFSGGSSLAVFAVPEEIEMDVTLDYCDETR